MIYELFINNLLCPTVKVYDIRIDEFPDSVFGRPKTWKTKKKWNYRELEDSSQVLVGPVSDLLRSRV